MRKKWGGGGRGGGSNLLIPTGLSPFSWGSLNRSSSEYPLSRWLNVTKWGGSFCWDHKNRGSVSQQVWHYKDPSLLLNGHKCWAKALSLQPFIVNSDMMINNKPPGLTPQPPQKKIKRKENRRWEYFQIDN